MLLGVFRRRDRFDMERNVVASVERIEVGRWRGRRKRVRLGLRAWSDWGEGSGEVVVASVERINVGRWRGGRKRVRVGLRAW